MPAAAKPRHKKVSKKQSQKASTKTLSRAKPVSDAIETQGENPENRLAMDLAHSISSPDRLKDLLTEIERELDTLQPEVERLEAVMSQLQALRQTRQKLITLKFSVQSILDTFSGEGDQTFSHSGIPPSYPVFSQGGPAGFREESPPRRERKASDKAVNLPEGVFSPETAQAHANTILRRKQSINYDIFRALVFYGGIANSDSIRQYLIDHGVTQPNTGKGFEDVPLADIASRINYLVRKGLVQPTGDNRFQIVHGWQTPLESNT